MKHFISVFTATILSLTLSLGTAFAQAGVAGTVIMAAGQVTAKNAQGVERVLSRRSEVFEQDTILTAANGRVQIRFIDNGLLALKENSQLNIQQYTLAKAQGQDSKVLMQLVEGGFRSLTGSIGKGTPEAYKINTPAASIGIRGTLYSVLLEGGNLIAGVWQGGIRLTTADGTGYDLGLDSNYQFGVLSPTGFTGLLQAPASLEDAPHNGSASSEQGSNSSQDTTDSATVPNSGAENQAGNANAPTDAPILSPLEQMDTELLERTLEKTKEPTHPAPQPNPNPNPNPDPVVPTNPTPTGDPRLSATEQATYSQALQNAGNRVALVSTLDSTSDGLIFTGDNNDYIFKEDNRRGATGEQLYRFSGTSTAITDANNGPMDIADVLPNLTGEAHWGLWEYTSNAPDQIKSSSSQNTTVQSFSKNIYWVEATPTPVTILPTSGELMFTPAAVIGEDNHGFKAQSYDGTLKIDFATGDILSSYSNLQLTFQDSSQSESFTWNIYFSGSIKENGQNTPYLTLIPDNVSMSYMYNAAPISGLDVAVTSKGMLIGETGVQGAITALQFSGKYEDQLQQNQYNTTANAIIVWNPQ